MNRNKLQCLNPNDWGSSSSTHWCTHYPYINLLELIVPQYNLTELHWKTSRTALHIVTRWRGQTVTSYFIVPKKLSLYSAAVCSGNVWETHEVRADHPLIMVKSPTPPVHMLKPTILLLLRPAPCMAVCVCMCVCVVIM